MGDMKQSFWKSTCLIVSLMFFTVSCENLGTPITLTPARLTQTEATGNALPVSATSTVTKSIATNTVSSLTGTSTPSWTSLPRGLYLFFKDDTRDGLYAMSVSDHQVIKVLDQYIANAIMMPDNRHIVLVDAGEQTILNLQDGSTTTVQLPKEFTVPYFVSFSPINDDIIWVSGFPGHGLPINGDGSFLYYYLSGANFSFRIQGSSPVWSPDGKYVAYEQDTYASPPMSMTVPYADITLLTIPCQASNADPCHERKLTHSSLAGEARKPSWSPDSKLLAYECSTTSYDGTSAPQDIFMVTQDICAISINGSGFHQLTHTTDFFESNPLWSPVDDSLAFSGAPSQYESSDLYLLNVKDEEIIKLTDTSDLSEIPLFWWNNQ